MESLFSLFRKGTNAKDDAGADTARSDDLARVLRDEHGQAVIESREIHRMPMHGHLLRGSESALSRVQHLVSDMFKGTAGIADKTVEVVFHPHVQKGLSDGTYQLMQTKSGEVLADAVSSTTRQIVGKGRLVEVGKARMMAAAGYQLLSIAVAQSHLSEIENSLASLRASMSDLIARQENADKAKIMGATRYLNEIAAHMRELRCPEELSSEKTHAIENVIQQVYVSESQLTEDLRHLTVNVQNLQSQDTFGTGDTYTALLDLVNSARPLFERHAELLRLLAALGYVTAYLDPARRTFTRVVYDGDRWSALVNTFQAAVTQRAETLLSSSFFNSSETLELRNSRLKSATRDQTAYTTASQADYRGEMKALDQNVERLVGVGGMIRLAVSFDAQGKVREAAVIS